MGLFNTGNLTSGVVGASESAATGIGSALGGALSSAVAIIAMGAIAMMASIKVDKDGKVDSDEELFQDIYKTLVGAYISANDSGTSFDLNKALSDYWQKNVSSLACGDNTGGSLTSRQQLINAHYIYDYLTAKGWSKNAICALIGNMEAESHLNPDSWENLNQTQGQTSGFGLVQWTPGDNFLNNIGAKDRPDIVNNMDSKELMDKELEYVLTQLNDTNQDTKQWRPTTGYGSPYRMTPEEYTKCDDHSSAELALV